MSMEEFLEKENPPKDVPIDTDGDGKGDAYFTGEYDENGNPIFRPIYNGANDTIGVVNFSYDESDGSMIYDIDNNGEFGNIGDIILDEWGYASLIIDIQDGNLTAIPIPFGKIKSIRRNGKGQILINLNNGHTIIFIKNN